jgi:acyl transferase domain-containing protein
VTAAPIDIAIVGMACTFPSAPDLATYWENVVAGVDAIGDPPDDWGADLVYDPGSTANDRLYTKRGGYLGELARFDPVAFGVMPRAVDGGEPEHFLALQTAHRALQDAGYAGADVDHERTAVILGRGTYINRGVITMVQHTVVVDQTVELLARLHPEHSQEELERIKSALKSSLPAFNAETAPSLCHSVMCGRISNRMDFMGPSYTVDAACASSLVALEIGVRQLMSDTCDLVLVGGVQVSTTFPIALVFAQLGALSRRGESRPLNPVSDGLLLGEGIGILALRRRPDAERDGDRIYAVVRGVGVASDGRAVGVLAPRAEGEELALRRAYRSADVAPSDVGLVEAHGTGTPVGDATEVEALRRVFGSGGGPKSCALGSVKSMIGHAIPAAGAAGLIKVALALHDRVLPPTLHAGDGHPGLDATPLYLNAETRPWINGRRAPRRAGVSAFGFGGINAHAVLEEHG